MHHLPEIRGRAAGGRLLMRHGIVKQPFPKIDLTAHHYSNLFLTTNADDA